MALLHALSYVGIAAGLLFVVLSIAGGLLWIAEVIEEHSVAAKTTGTRMIYAVIALHCILYFSDTLPLRQTLFSICCHIIYLQNFSNSWPQISLTSFYFLASCVLSLTNHFLWFFYFSRQSRDARHQIHRQYRGPGSVPAPQHVPAFADIATFFALCVWLVPLFLFLSLSANDDSLPVTSSRKANSRPNSPTSYSAPEPNSTVRLRSSLFKSLVGFVTPRRGSRREMEGILAPLTPLPTSPSSSFTFLRQQSSPVPPLSPSSSAHFDSMRRSVSGDRGASVDGFLRPATLSPAPPPRRMASDQSLKARPHVVRSMTDGVNFR